MRERENDMSLTIDNYNEEGGGDFKDIEAGTHAARIIGVFDAGWQKGFSEEDKPKHSCVLVYEVDEKTDDGKFRLTISEPYTATLRSDKAKLRGPVQAAFPKLTEAQKTSFELSTLIGKGVLITVAQKPSGKMKVSQVAPLPKGMEAHEGWEECTEVFGLAKWMQEHQLTNEEAEELRKRAVVAASDDIPF